MDGTSAKVSHHRSGPFTEQESEFFKETEHFLVFLIHCSATGSFDRERNHFISINQQSRYQINKKSLYKC